MPPIDEWPCVDPPYKTQFEADLARMKNFGYYPRVTWQCIDGHFHEGELA